MRRIVMVMALALASCGGEDSEEDGGAPCPENTDPGDKGSAECVACVDEASNACFVDEAGECHAELLAYAACLDDNGGDAAACTDEEAIGDACFAECAAFKACLP